MKVDFRRGRRLPSPVNFALATLVAIVGSLVADWALVKVATTVSPALKGYVHFRFSDYGLLTVVGVVGACLGWPVVLSISYAPRWLFLRLAVVVTIVLWLPDIWILSQGQSARAVLVLMVMHVAVAVVTYNALVHIAPASPTTDETAGPSANVPASDGS